MIDYKKLISERDRSKRYYDCDTGLMAFAKDEMNWDNEIVEMDYVGIKDRCGTRIHEGDVVKHDNGLIGVVVFESLVTHSPAFVVKFGEGVFEVCSFYTPDGSSKHQPAEFEIVGNIFEHPTLIK